MSDPKTIREVDFKFGGLLDGLEKRLALLLRLIWVVLGLLGAIFATAGALYKSTGDLHGDVAVVRTQLAGLKEQVTKIEKALEADRAVGARMSASLSRIEQVFANRSPLGALLASAKLGDWERQLIRDAIKAQPVPATPPLKVIFKIGEKVPLNALRPLPDVVEAKIPWLKGVRFAVDERGAIALVAPQNDEVLAVIEPS